MPDVVNETKHLQNHFACVPGRYNFFTNGLFCMPNIFNNLKYNCYGINNIGGAKREQRWRQGTILVSRSGYCQCQGQ